VYISKQYKNTHHVISKESTIQLLNRECNLTCLWLWDFICAWHIFKFCRTSRQLIYTHIYLNSCTCTFIFRP